MSSLLSTPTQRASSSGTVTKRLVKKLRGAYYQFRLSASKYASLYDRDFYLKLYPDVATANLSPEEHFFCFGRREGRIAKAPQLELLGNPESEFDSSKDTILVVSHEASRTGAPILSVNLVRVLAQRYNVVSLLLGGGPLIQAFRDAGSVVMGPYDFRHNPFLADLLIEQLLHRCLIRFALVNSIESRAALIPLARRFVPRISLLHEFAAYTRPRQAFREALFWSNDSVFSTKLTLQNALEEYPDLDEDVAHVLPQGRCILPAGGAKIRPVQHDQLLKGLRPSDCAKNTFLIVGVGFVQVRKGVDLFIECASRVIRSQPHRPIRFAWIGKGYDPDHDVGYSVYLADQVKRAGLEKHLVFLNETSEIDVVYQQADVLLLTSRLDPLPNVAIDALCEGLPVVCFENTTGIADILLDEGLGGHCVAGYLDGQDMAQKLLVLASDRNAYEDVASRSRQLASTRFNMDEYVQQLERIALSTLSKASQESVDAAIVANSDVIRHDYWALPHTQQQTKEQAALGYIRTWACGMGQRKPFPGFHPGVYQEQNKLALSGPDPLTDFIRNGRPNGPWLNQVISESTPVPEGRGGIKVALHLHVYYPKLLSEMLKRLSQNRLLPDLFVSVPNDRVHQSVVEQLCAYPGVVQEVMTVPNRGRDIGPLLTGFAARLASEYEYIGHLHTKMSADIRDRSVGESWYHFLLENLLGGKAGPMADRIIGQMQADPMIGLVFPDDPNAVGWSANLEFARELAEPLKIKSLPQHFLFPVGTMFWARAEALQPFWDLNLQWADYPEEPLPYDGSMLHALERLFSLSVTNNSMRCAVTNVSGITR